MGKERNTYVFDDICTNIYFGLGRSQRYVWCHGRSWNLSPLFKVFHCCFFRHPSWGISRSLVMFTVMWPMTAPGLKHVLNESQLHVRLVCDIMSDFIVTEFRKSNCWSIWKYVTWLILWWLQMWQIQGVSWSFQAEQLMIMLYRYWYRKRGKTTVLKSFSKVDYCEC